MNPCNQSIKNEAERNERNKTGFNGYYISRNAPAFDGVGIAVPSPGNLFLLVFDEQVGGDYARAALDDRRGIVLTSGSEPERLKKANAVVGLCQTTAS